MKSSEFITEDDDNVTKGDFGAKGGPKPQIQHAKKISMAQAFGSEGYNILHNAGISLIEKPTHWADLERSPLGEVTFQKIKKLFRNAHKDLPEVDAWEVYPIVPEDVLDDPEFAGEYSIDETFVRGPLASVEDVPVRDIFVIRNLPYKNENTRTIEHGDFLVDSHGAKSYIRFWRKI